MSTTKNNENLPVIIAGAGPCGIVAAMTLQKEGIPFVILERASRESLCSNAGSGFDLAPTVIDILRNRLEVSGVESGKNGFEQYGGMYMCDMDGKEVRECAMADMTNRAGKLMESITANRAAMQERFLEHIFANEQKKSNDCDESTILKCGVEVVGYEDNEEEKRVTVKLNDGSTMVGSALLACDGIHSAVRKCFMSSISSSPVQDELRSCNTICWWGKMDLNKEGAFYKAFDKTQKRKEQGASFMWALGDSSRPGCYMGAPAQHSFLWAFFVKANDVPTKFSDDLTSRGGIKLDEESKQSLLKLVADRGELIRLAIEETPPSGITKAGLFDRENLDLPYSKGRVALLGDAAHPQSPFMGQGVNQAITDAYVCGMRLARQSSVEVALNDYNSETRREEVNDVIKQARSYGDMSVSSNWFVCWLFYVVSKWMPVSWLWADMIDGDTANKNFVSQLDKDLGPLKSVGDVVEAK